MTFNKTWEDLEKTILEVATPESGYFVDSLKLVALRKTCQAFYDNGYDNGHKAGYDDGYDSGYEEGFYHPGYEQGYESGYEQGVHDERSPL